MPYEKVCKAFDALELADLTIREKLREAPLEKIVLVLKSTGFRFPNQTGNFLKNFGENNIDLSTAPREEIAKIKGIGMKLASMFLRNTRGEELAVIDVHIRNFLKEHNALGKNYLESETNFKKIADQLGMKPSELDFYIWEQRRIGNRKKKTI